jgi:hypothetical protein
LYGPDAAARPSAPRGIGVVFIQAHPMTTATFTVYVIGSDATPVIS